jgi:HK97 family phage major capsid protein
MARKTSADIRAEIADYTSSAQALLDIAKEADRDFDTEEEALFNDYSAKLETAQTELKKAEDFEARRRQIAELQVMQSQPLAPIGGVSIKGAADRLRVHHRIGPMNAFKGPEAARDAYDCGMWLRAVVARGHRQNDEEAEARVATRGWDVRAISTEGTPTGGGYLVPTPLSNAIIDVRALAGISRQICRVVPMTAETQTIARKTAGTTVYYPGETGTTTASDQTWGQVQLTAKKRAILSKVSQELRDDAIIAVVDDLASQMGTDFAVKEDAELIDGDGTSTYGGEVGLLAALGSAGVSTAATGHDLWSELDMADFTAAMALLPDKYWQYMPSWVCSSAFYFAAMLRVQASAGGNTIGSLEQGAVGRPMFLGYPVYFTNQMPTSTAAATVAALFGAYSQAAVIGDRMGITIAQSEHLGFAEDVLAVRATTRYDINVYDSGSATANDVGAYVGLKTAS